MKKVCIIGYPAKHSLSPVIHGYWLEKYGIEGKYEIRETEPEKFDDFFRNLHEEGYVGCNITVPFKEMAYQLIKENGRLIGNDNYLGAINTIQIKDGQYFGVSTDIFGFFENIKINSPEFEFKNSNVVILGGGGAARSIISDIVLKGAKQVILTNRTKKNVEKIKDELTDIYSRKVKIFDWEQRSEALSGANLLVNTTSLGMVGQPPLEIDLTNLPKDALVTDIVYKPLITPLLQQAKDRGNPIVDGLGMLLYQAVPGFEMWFAEELKAKGIKGVEVTPELRKLVESKL